VASREEMKPWIIAALDSLGGRAWPSDVARYIWHNYEAEIRSSGPLLYTWQYDTRWAAMSLRKAGRLKAVNGRRDLPWELA
jgi:hypothetical protein